MLISKLHDAISKILCDFFLWPFISYIVSIRSLRASQAGIILLYANKKDISFKFFQTASHQDKKKVSSEEKPLNRKPKRKKNKSSTLPSGPKSAKQPSVQDSSNVKAEQPKLKKKPPAVVARDRARRKEYWKCMKVPRQLRAENLALFYKLQKSDLLIYKMHNCDDMW